MGLQFQRESPYGREGTAASRVESLEITFPSPLGEWRKKLKVGIKL